MANELTLHAAPTTALSLPDFLARLQLGAVQWPGQPVRKYLAGNSNLSSSQRAEAERSRAQLEQTLSPGGELGDEARAVILLRMVMGLGGPALTAQGAEARADAYRDAVDDLPAWSIHQAVKRWHRGECGDHNYAFPPAPAVLRQIAQGLCEPYRAALEKVNCALDAVTLERAMDSTPIEQKSPVITRLKAV
jgi:hypothetical protein